MAERHIAGSDQRHADHDQREHKNNDDACAAAPRLWTQSSPHPSTAMSALTKRMLSYSFCHGCDIPPVGPEERPWWRMARGLPMKPLPSERRQPPRPTGDRLDASLPRPAQLQLSPGLRGSVSASPVVYLAVMPPSATTTVPVTKEDSSEARKRATLAISRGSPGRPTGWNESMVA
jgi:hypothetical protein